MTTTPDEAPHCYFAVYADPRAIGHVTIEGGKFGNRNMPKNMVSGDMVLLYCTSSYAGYEKSIPAMGLITAVDHDQRDFWYDFMPFEEPVPLDFVRFVVTDDDRTHIANMRHEWLFQISRESFRSIMQGAKLKSNRPTGSG